MDVSMKSIGQTLQNLFSGLRRRPMGWNLIDAFSRLEEREEAANPQAQTDDETEPNDFGR
jgi:hypothetical protein